MHRAALLLLYEPATHTLHVEAPELEKLPAGQDSHTSTSVAPVMLLYVPEGHALHSVLLVAAMVLLHVPGGHCKQTDEFWEAFDQYVPAIHATH